MAEYLSEEDMNTGEYISRDEDEAYEMVRQALHNPMSNDIFISSPATNETRFDWFSL